MMREGKLVKRELLWIVVTVLANVAILADVFPLRIPSAILIGCFLPGFLLIEFLFPGRGSLSMVERLTLGSGASYVLSTLSLLVLNYLPGGISLGSTLFTYDLIIVILLCLRALRKDGRRPLQGRKATSDVALSLSALRRSLESRSFRRSEAIMLIVVMAIAAYFRFAHLSYSDFQGDEVRVMLKGLAIIRGEADAIFLHKKGPAEILIPTAFCLLAGRFNEFVARLPFALAGTIGTAAIFLAGSGMFGDLAGLAAGSLLAINGFLVGSSRIVQYQSLVLLMMGLAVFCYHRFRGMHDGRYLLLGTLFLASGLLAHYEAACVVPAALLLCIKRPGWREQSAPLLASLGILTCALGLFYLPFLSHPHLETMGDYLARKMGDDQPYFNFDRFFLRSTTYNSTYYVLLMALLLVMVIVDGLRWRKLPLLSILGVMVAFLAPSWLQFKGADLRFVPFLVIFALLFISPRVSVDLKACFLWLLGPFVAYIFLVHRPNTHFYCLFPAWSLICGATSENLWRKAHKPTARYLLLATCCLLYALCAYYIHIAFVRHNPIYTRAYPESKPRFYWTIYGEKIPFGTRTGFGFPHRFGWKTIAHLYRSGFLNGDYDSNETAFFLNWYTMGIPRSRGCRPKYYFIAEELQDRGDVPASLIDEEYALIANVLVEGDVKLRIYERSPSPPPPPRDFDDLDRAEDTLPCQSLPHAPCPPAIRHPVGANLGNKVELIGYDLEHRDSELLLTLYWQAMTEMEKSYKVFVHLETDRIWAQSDAVPACYTRPTTGWKRGEVVVDNHLIPIPPDIPLGDIPLRVGMYEPDTGPRLWVLDEMGEVVGDHIVLTTIHLPPRRIAGKGARSVTETPRGKNYAAQKAQRNV